MASQPNLATDQMAEVVRAWVDLCLQLIQTNKSPDSFRSQKSPKFHTIKKRAPSEKLPPLKLIK